MSSRYKDTRLKKGVVFRGQKLLAYEVTAYSTTIYSAIPKTDNDVYILTQMGDRLDHVAQKYYGDASLWWYIAKANGLKFMTLPAGTSLRIPASTKFATGR